MSPEELASLWAAWDQRPGNDKTAANLVAAINDYVGPDEANAFHRHVTAARRHGLTVLAAIYSWGPI